MARIRSIKPEFWDSPSTAQAGPWARLCYIAMWNWADDYGRGTANLKELEGFVFPNDDTFTDRSGNTVNFRAVVAEVSECFGVVLYEVDGRRFYEIPHWDRHQRNERRSKESRYPSPPPEPPPTRGNATGAEVHGISATQERKVAEAPNSSGPGTGEQGNRGTGDSAIAGNVVPEPDALVELPPPDNVRHLPDTQTDPEPATSQTLIAEWIDHRKTTTGTRPTGKVIGQLSREIKNLLDEGQPYEHVRAGLQLWDTKSMHPATLASCVDEARAPRRSTNHHQQHTDQIISGALQRAATGAPNPFMTEEERRRAK